MKIVIFAIISLTAFTIQSALAELDTQKLKHYRPLMSETSGSEQRRHLNTIDAYRPWGSTIEISKRISNQDFLEVLKQKIENTTTFDDSKLKCTILKNATVIAELDVELKTASLVEALEYYCSLTGNIWILEQRKEGVTLIIRNRDDNAK